MRRTLDFLLTTMSEPTTAVAVIIHTRKAHKTRIVTEILKINMSTVNHTYTSSSVQPNSGGTLRSLLDWCSFPECFRA